MGRKKGENSTPKAKGDAITSIDDIITHVADGLRKINDRIADLQDEAWIAIRLEKLNEKRERIEQELTVLNVVANQLVDLGPKSEQLDLPNLQEVADNAQTALDEVDDEPQPAGLDHNGKPADPHEKKRKRLAGVVA